jgi:hypothetical protein
MTDKELANNLVFYAKLSAEDGQPNVCMIDYKEHFGDGRYNFDEFKAECNSLGYDVVPLEQSIIRMFPLFGKYVVQKI